MSPVCPYCGEDAKLVGGDAIYPHRPDLADKSFWRCVPCKAWVGCHPGTQTPLGRLANAELRNAKMAVHGILDPLWKSRKLPRSSVYKRLADGLGINRDECHVGMFDVDTCRRAIAVLKSWRTT